MTAKPDTLPLASINVMLRGPDVPPLEVNGWAAVGKPGLAVTPVYTTEDGQDWQILLGYFFVTHTPSGYRLGLYPIEQDEAIKAMHALHSLGLDWTKAQDHFTQDEKARARAVLRKFRML